MKDPLSDDDVCQRVQDVARREAAAAPHFARVLLGRRREPEGIPARPGIAAWLRPAVGLAGVFVVVAVAWWWRMRPESGGPVVRHAERSSSDAADEWGLPTDGLLIETVDGAGNREVERLSREIEGLLRP